MICTGQLRVLVTAVGTINGSTVVEELKKYKDQPIYVIGANSTPRNYVVTSKFVDEYHEFPSAMDNQELYLSFVLSFCKEHEVNHLICFIDEEVELFTRNRERFEKIGVKLCLPDYETVSLCHYKDIFSDWIKDNFPEIWIKRYTSFDCLTDYDFPIFVKPVEGRASIGCKTIKNKDELKTFLAESNNGDGFIFQEKVDGDLVGVDIIRNKEYKQLILIQKQELMRNSNGCGTVVKMINDLNLTKICERLAEQLDLNGLINVEFFMSRKGPKIIEINPRLPAGTSYSCMAGGNTVINTLLISEKKQCISDEIKVGKVYARRYETYEM